MNIVLDMVSNCPIIETIQYHNHLLDALFQQNVLFNSLHTSQFKHIAHLS